MSVFLLSPVWFQGKVSGATDPGSASWETAFVVSTCNMQLLLTCRPWIPAPFPLPPPQPPSKKQHKTQNRVRHEDPEFEVKGKKKASSTHSSRKCQGLDFDGFQPHSFNFFGTVIFLCVCPYSQCTNVVSLNIPELAASTSLSVSSFDLSGLELLYSVMLAGNVVSARLSVCMIVCTKRCSRY